MAKKSKKRKVSYKDKVKKLSLGLFDTLIDLCLFTLFFHLQAYKIAYGKRNVSEAIDKAIHATKIVHANSLGRVIYKIKSRGYLEKKKDYLKITKLGKERLNRVLPLYEQERPWDGRLYLITYDIPEEKKRERDYLRDFLKRLGCGMLQKSVWLTPYNPKGVIVEFIGERKLAGLVLVSELREGSGIGGKDILTVVERVYKLDKINEEYYEFVQKVEAKELEGFQLLIVYLAILKKDPQLPFELLPPNWWGKEAHRLFKKEIKRDKENERDKQREKGEEKLS